MSAQTLVIGRPYPNRWSETTGVRPLRHQLLVTSICKLWRQINFVVRPPRVKGSLVCGGNRFLPSSRDLER